MYYIPTYSECIKISDKNQTMDFYYTTHNIQGHRVDIFNYKFAFYKEFYEIANEFNIPHSKEMRGLTFVFNDNIIPGKDYSIIELENNIFNRYIALEKFFNINQTQETLIENFYNVPIKNISEKYDGSLALFIKLPNNKIVAKTKAGFNNEQTERIQYIYNNNDYIYNLVNYCFDNNIIPIFEYVSFSNKVVLDYNEEKLVLTKLRNNTTGKYIDIYDLPNNILNKIDISIPKTVQEFINEYDNNTTDYSINNVFNIVSNLEKIEGIVVQFVNGYQIKIKTKWYFDNHKLMSEFVHLEHHLINLILTNKIDDVLSQMDKNVNCSVINNINIIIDKLNTYITNLTNVLLPFINEFYNNINDYSLFTKKYKKYEYYHLIMGIIRKDNKVNNMIIQDEISKFILRNTSKLNQAKQFLNKI